MNSVYNFTGDIRVGVTLRYYCAGGFYAYGTTEFINKCIGPNWEMGAFPRCCKYKSICIRIFLFLKYQYKFTVNLFSSVICVHSLNEGYLCMRLKSKSKKGTIFFKAWRYVCENESRVNYFLNMSILMLIKYVVKLSFINLLLNI